MTLPAKQSGHSTLPLLDLDVIRSFIAIAETGSFSRAASQIFRTPSALSMQIKKLEETLGQTLFVRESRRVSLTPAGETLLGYSRRLLKLNDETVGNFLSPSVEGMVRFGAVDNMEVSLLPDIMSEFARSHPGVQVDIVIGQSVDLIKRFDDNELDLVLFTSGCKGSPSNQGEVVFREQLMWAHREGGIVHEQTPVPVALANQSCPWRTTAINALNKADIPYRVAYSCESYVAQEAAMLADLAVAPFPESLIKPPLIRLEDTSRLPELEFYELELITHESAGPATDALRQHVKNALKKAN